MGATYGSQDNTDIASGATITITKPSGVVAGSVLICRIAATVGTAWSDDDGTWTGPVAVSGSSATFYKVAGGSEPASYGFTRTGTTAGSARAVIERWAGANTTTPVENTAGLQSTTANIVAPSVVAAVADSVLSTSLVNAASNTAAVTVPSGMAQQYQINTTEPVKAGAALGVGAGATGTKTWTNALANNYTSSVILNPATQVVTPTGFDTSVTFGAPELRGTVTPSGFDLAVSFGVPTISGSQILTPAGFDLAVTFGTPTIILDNVLNVAGFDVPVQFGSASLATQPVVAGTVFNHETGDPVAAGVTVKLFDDNDLLVDSTVTDASGGYLFFRPFGDTDLYWTLATYEVLGVQYHGVSDRGCPAT